MPNTLEIFSCGAHVLIYNNGKKTEVKRTMSEILAFCEENKIDVLIGDIKAYDKTRVEVETERKAQQNQ